MATKVKKAQGGFNVKSREMLKSAFDYAKKKKDNYSGTELSPEMKAYYTDLIKKKAADAEADRKTKPKGYKSGGKVVKKAAKAKYGVKKAAKKK
jgi:hypothetical protein